MAIGRPDRIALRLTETGTNTVWIYTVPDSRDSGRFVQTVGYVRDSRGRLRAVPDVIWMDDLYWRYPAETDRLRVEFREGKVTAFESIR